MAKSTIERKIMFYHLRSHPTLWEPRAQIDIPSILRHIHTLTFPTPKTQGRYWVDEDNKTYCCWIESIRPEYCCIQFGKLRENSALPQIEYQGALSPLSQQIPIAASIAEVMHIVFFPDNIIGAEHNHYGPRMPNLINYLMAKALDPIKLHSDILLKHDAVEKLQNMQEITFMRLQLPATFIDIQGMSDNDVIKGLRTIHDLSEADSIELVLRKHTHQPLAKRFISSLAALFRRNDFVTELEKVVVRGADHESINQLSDKLIITSKFKRPDRTSRQIIREDMFNAIITGYNELHEELIQTAGVEL